MQYVIKFLFVIPIILLNSVFMSTYWKRELGDYRSSDEHNLRFFIALLLIDYLKPLNLKVEKSYLEGIFKMVKYKIKGLGGFSEDDFLKVFTKNYYYIRRDDRKLYNKMRKTLKEKLSQMMQILIKEVKDEQRAS